MSKAMKHRLEVLLGLMAGALLAGCGGGSPTATLSGTGGTVSTDGVLDAAPVPVTGGAPSVGGTQSSSSMGGGQASSSAGGGQTTSSAGGTAKSTGVPDAAVAAGGNSGSRDAGPGPTEVGAPTQCPEPPAGAPAEAVTALNAENAARVAMGIPCASLVLALCTSSLNHCNYYTTNQGSATCQAPSAHNEISGCPQFTGADPGARVKAAKYTGNGWSECMAFLGDPAGAVKTFIDSVYHRTPVLSPWYRDMGYGGGVGCDTIDFGPGTTTAKTVTAVYPYDGQIGVPLSFNGAQEGPTPPVPSTGWPSGYPITLYGQGITVSAHSIVVDGTTTPLAHVWLDGDATLGSTAKVLYTEAPLTANTTYRVTIEGSTSSGSVHFEWTFTTGAASTRPGGGRRG
jgi:hypothetical protein